MFKGLMVIGCAASLFAYSPLDNYFQRYEALSIEGNWSQMIKEGEFVLLDLEEKKSAIAADLASTHFYLGNYDLACEYATIAYESSKPLVDQTLKIRACYLKSSAYRGLGGKEKDLEKQRAFFEKAIELCREAISIASEGHPLTGKIYYNLAAAYADNPNPSLEFAKQYYEEALSCFEPGSENFIRTLIRMGKIRLLQKELGAVGELIEQARSYPVSNRISLQIDYLEAQFLKEIGELDAAYRMARIALKKAEALSAKQDVFRVKELLRNLY